MMDHVKKSTWIGLNDFQDTQTLTWSDKSRVTYTKWYVILYFSAKSVGKTRDKSIYFCVKNLRFT